MIHHARLMAERRGEARGVTEFRKQPVAYLRGIPGSREVKTALMQTRSLAELEARLRQALERAPRSHAVRRGSGGASRRAETGD
jgi:tRNA-dihydrouridine synthase